MPIADSFIDEAGRSVDKCTVVCHKIAVDAGWWTDLKTGASLIGKRNFGEMLCLVHSEISEAMEGHRKSLKDDKLPQYPMAAVELADALIRVFDLGGAYDWPLGEIFAAKLRYNIAREDHKIKNRMKEGGKAY